MYRSDEHLLELALQGDAACFGELIERWRRKIQGFIRRYVGSREEAEDLTQDTFAKAYRNLQGLSDPARFSSWLYKIALNECRMRFRRHVRMPPAWEGDPERDGLGALPAATVAPDVQLAVREEAQLVRQALERLTEEQRVVILMKEYQELKFHEIAEILGVPLSTVKSRMYLGLKNLKKLMEI